MDRDLEAMSDSKPSPKAVIGLAANLNASEVPPPLDDDPDTALEHLLSQLETHFLIHPPLGHQSSRVELLSSDFKLREQQFRCRYALYFERTGIFRLSILIRLTTSAIVVAIIMFAVDEAFNHPDPTVQRTGYLWIIPIVAVPVLVAECVLRLCGLLSLYASVAASVQAFVKPDSLRIMSSYMKDSEQQNRAIYSILDLLNESLAKWKKRAEVLEFTFASLTRTFDEAVASQKMLKAQNTALNVHIGQKSDAFLELSTQNAKLQQEVTELRRIRDSMVSVKNNGVSSSLRHDAALAELALQRQQAHAMQDEANAMLDAANKKMTVANELLEKAKQTQEEANVHAKDTNAKCEELRETMRQSELLECERVTKLRKLAESRYGEGVLELEALEAAEAEDGEECDAENSKGKELSFNPSPGGAVLPPRPKKPLKPEAVLRGRYNTFLPAFRFSAGAPRMVTTGSRVDAVSRLNASDYALAWPATVKGVIQDASAEAKARAKRARKGAVEPKVDAGTVVAAGGKRGKGELGRDRGKVGKQGKRR